MRRIKIFTGWCGLFLAAVILFVGVFAGVLVWRIAQGPVSLHRLVPYVVAELNESSGDTKFEVGDMVLFWRGWEERFDIRLQDVSVRDGAGSEMLHVPEADVVFSSKALFDGVLALRELNLIAPKLRLVRHANGQIDIGYNPEGQAEAETPLQSLPVPDFKTDPKTEPEPETAPEPAQNNPGAPASGDASGNNAEQPGVNMPLPSPSEGTGTEPDQSLSDAQRGIRDGSAAMREIVAILSGEMADFPAAAYFESFGVSGADLQVWDEALDLVWAAPSADIRLSRKPMGIHAEATMKVNAGLVSTDVNVTAEYDSRVEEIDMVADIGEVIPSNLTSISDTFIDLAGVDVPVSGRLTAKLGADGSVIELGTDLDLGVGRVDLPAPMVAAYHVTGGKVGLSFVPGRLSFDDVRIEAGETAAVLKGQAINPLGQWAIDITATATDVRTNDLPQLWPETVGDNARTWVVENLTEGIVHQAELRTRLHQDETGNIIVDHLDGEMNMTGVTVHYLGDMPSVLGAGGRAEFDQSSFSIFVNEGEADGIVVDEATLVFSQLDTDSEMADFEIVAHGGARNALEMIDEEPLGFATQLGIDPAQIEGEQATRVKLHFPLLKDLSFDDVEVAAASRIENAAITDAFRDLDISDGTFELQVNTKGLELSGEAAIGKGRTNIKWVESFADDTPVISHYDLEGDLDLAALEQVGFAADPYLSGVATGKVTIEHLRSNEVAIKAQTSLSAADIALDMVDYHKTPGQDASLAFDLTVKANGAGEVRSFDLMAPELVAKAKGRWRGDSPIADKFTVNLTDTRFRENLAIAGAITVDQGGKLLVDLKGKQFDLRPFVEDKPTDGSEKTANPAGDFEAMDIRLEAADFLIKGERPVLRDGSILLHQTGENREIEINARQADAQPWLVGDDDAPREPGPAESPNSGGIGQNASRTGGRTDIFLSIDQLIMANGELIDEIDGSIHVVGDEWDGLVLNGTMGDRANVFAQVERKDPKTRNVRLTSDDAGKFLRAVDLYENLLGGALTIEGTVDDSTWSQPFTGKVNITAFRAVNAPLAARVLGAASLTGLADVLGGNGIAFSELNGDFTYANDVLSLSKFAANGSAVGVTSNGSIDLAKSEIRLAGSIVPIYSLNSALGAIPLLGDLLVGEEGGGIFAPTYTIEGALDDPEVTVNPLSTFVPGVFRNLITGAEPG
ncbi:AsmA-like C-terminal domain-containing protein [Thalassospira lucentensis]|uniref:YhdP family protein n=1 Tax=Thalassospira lucentensis TaxID=168935 RepID=UPI002943C3C1|nr:AsmA-like C-terminal domain-containing protein [Thalassospira lucentensis]WOI10926.1 AsmA-like C-terminal domain-containing protein [Thalassospira lucentensis]